MEWNGMGWNGIMEWNGVEWILVEYDYFSGCILVILCHFETFGHFGSKFGCFCSKNFKKSEFRDPPEADPSDY